ncbi:MAG: NAD(P)-dependent alcohol dehydrogenase [Flaviflexus sp.]|nr:NAD(P)-dependent alcohol dehydrogenase [Flaviflexus sp.]
MERTTIPQTMKASVLLEKGKIELQEREVPTPVGNEVLVKIAACGVCGSDVHYYETGRIGDFIVEEPMILGHEAAGTIVAVGEDVDPARVGQRVSIEPQKCCRVCEYCKAGEYNLCPDIEFYATPPIDGAFCEYQIIEDDFAYELPEGVSFEAGALIEPLSVGIAAVQKAHIGVGSTVHVAGAGPIGLITAQVAKAFGAAKVIVSDISAPRLKIATELGADEVIEVGKDEPLGEKVNAFIDCTGAPKAMYDGILGVAPGGYAILVGMGPDDIELPVGYITSREVSVTGIFRYNNTWPIGIQLLEDGVVNLDVLVSHRFGLDEVEDSLDLKSRQDSMKHVVCP